MQPEKLGRSNCLSWHSRLSRVSWLLGQKPCSHGRTRLSFLLLLSPECLGKNPIVMLTKIPTGCCLKEDKNSPRPQPASLSLFPIPTAAFPQVCLWTAKGNKQNPRSGMHRQTARWPESCVPFCCHLQSSGNERKSTCNSMVKWAYFRFCRSTYIFLAFSAALFSWYFEPL